MVKLADVRLSPYHFQPGDRVLVKCKDGLSYNERTKLYNAVKGWVPKGVEVLVIEKGQADIEHLTKIR